jgi:hypothetical protein
MSDEMEISTSNQLNLQLEKDGNIEIAGDCQLEFGYRQCVVFEPFQVLFQLLINKFSGVNYISILCT